MRQLSVAAAARRQNAVGAARPPGVPAVHQLSFGRGGEGPDGVELVVAVVAR